jgi:hypothetical protein
LFCACTPDTHNINYGEADILQEYRQGRLAVFAGNWLDAMCRCRMDILCFEPVRQGQNQSDEEEKKDWLFEEVLITFSCPPLWLLGRSPFSDICKVREGAPLFSLTYLVRVAGSLP